MQQSRCPLQDEGERTIKELRTRKGPRLTRSGYHKHMQPIAYQWAKKYDRGKGLELFFRSYPLLLEVRQAELVYRNKLLLNIWIFSWSYLLPFTCGKSLHLRGSQSSCKWAAGLPHE